MEIGRAETVETVDISQASIDDWTSDEGITAFLRTLIRTKVLSTAIRRLEERNISEQILERRMASLSKLVAMYATGTDLNELGDEDTGFVWTEDALLRHLAALTGDLRGAFSVLEGAAQTLGKSWETDSRNFLDVTIGMSRLQILMRKLVHRNMNTRAHTTSGTALVAVATGEEHTFGQCMLEEILRAHGWATVLFNPEQTGGFLRRVQEEGAHLVCFSWISPHLQPLVATDLAALEAMPLYERPIVIAGGYAAVEKEKWMVSHGVDRICSNAYSALEIATQITEAIDNERHLFKGGNAPEMLSGRT